MIEGELTPREIVEELNKYIIGQDAAKRAVAVALRNRARRRLIADELRDEVIPKNILMIGPTGVGKTEIARRLANLANAPFIKVEATKYTEVGYVGRDVESMVRDLVDTAYHMVEEEFFDDVWEEAERRAEQRLIDALAGQQQSTPPPATPAAEGEETTELALRHSEMVRQQNERVRQFTERRLRNGELEETEVDIEVEDTNWQTMQVFSGAGFEEMGFNMQDMLGHMFPPKRSNKRMTVAEARKVLTYQEAERLIDQQEVSREALERVEESAIVFLDEIDKIAGREGGHGPEVSREGVQRDILPIIEGSTVMTKYGPVDTSHILFIAAGAFHVTKPSDLIPELQGRFPIRVELKSLSEEDFCKILVEPENSLVKQYTALLGTEGLTLDFKPEAIAEIAKLARQVNESAENIGARRLYTMMEKMLEELSFEAPDMKQQKVVIDQEYVHRQLKDVVDDQDLSRYML